MQMYKLFALAIVTLAAVFMAACGDDDDDTATPTPAPSATGPADGGDTAFFDCNAAHPSTDPDASAFPLTITDPSGREVTIDEPPTQIASLSAGHTEVLYAIGAGAQVSAIDNTSNCPVEAATIEATVDAFNPSVEAITALEPDLIILFYDPGDLVTGLEAAGATVLMMTTPANIADVYGQIVLLGQATGHQSEAEALTTDMRSAIDDIVAGNQGEIAPSVYHELDNTYFSVGPGSFIGDLYETLGAKNIADATGEPYPQLSAEAIIDANPDVIILADEGVGEDADTVAARPGWDAIGAVRNDRVYGIDPDVISRPGPRIVDALQELSDDLYGGGN